MLKQHTIISQFLWVSQARTWGPRFSAQFLTVLQLKAGSHLKAQLVKGSASKLIAWLSAGFGSFGLLDWGPQFLTLLAACHCQFLASWASPTWQLSSSKLERESLLQRWKLQSLIMQSKKWHPITFAIFCWLRACHRSCPCSKIGDYTKAWVAEWDNWEPFQSISHREWRINLTQRYLQHSMGEVGEKQMEARIGRF